MYDRIVIPLTTQGKNDMSDHLNIDLDGLSEASEVTPIWEYQSDSETWTAYAYFIKYYLHQTAPRRYIKAFRQYKSEMLGVPIDSEKILKLSKVPSNWERMIYNLDNKHKKKEDNDLPTWLERAHKYDEFLVMEVHAMTQQRKLLSTIEHLDTIRHLKDKWGEMWKIAKILRQTGTYEVPTQSVDKDGKVITTYETVKIKALNTGQFRSLIRAYDDIVEIERRELGLPQEIRQSQIADNKGDELNLMPRGMFESLLGEAMTEIADWKRDNS